MEWNECCSILRLWEAEPRLERSKLENSIDSSRTWWWNGGDVDGSVAVFLDLAKQFASFDVKDNDATIAHACEDLLANDRKRRDMSVALILPFEARWLDFNGCDTTSAVVCARDDYRVVACELHAHDVGNVSSEPDMRLGWQSQHVQVAVSIPDHNIAAWGHRHCRDDCEVGVDDSQAVACKSRIEQDKPIDAEAMHANQWRSPT